MLWGWCRQTGVLAAGGMCPHICPAGQEGAGDRDGGLSCVSLCAGRDTGSLPACSQHHGPDPARPLVLEALLVVLEWPPVQLSPLIPRQGTLGDSWEGDGCQAPRAISNSLG